MTSATADLRPSTSSAMSEVEVSGRTVAIRQTISNLPFGGEDSTLYWGMPQPQSGPTRWIICQSGLDTTKLLEVSVAPEMSVAASSPLTSKDYQVTLDRIRELKLGDEEEQPSEYAYDRALRLLRDLAGILGMQFSRAIAVTGPDKCIRLLWTRREREVRVTVGGSDKNKSYLYWQAFGHSGIEARLDGRTLHRYLTWLARGM